MTNAELATACEKGVALKDHYHFEHIGVSVTRTVCLPEGDGVPDVVTTDDATGKLGTYVKGSSNANNNYQYVAFVNGSGVQKDYTIKVMMLDWAGLSGTTFGIAWSS